VVINRPAPRCPECGGERTWYGNVELWRGNSRGSDDYLDVAACGNCGYSSLYLRNLPSADGESALLPGARPSREEIRAFAKSTREQKKQEKKSRRN
jgi:predicted nucleic-acid-binding Zn-ribbon protein